MRANGAARWGPPRILLAKTGLDGHDRGVHIVARILRDAGFEVVYTGLRATPEEIATAAVQEDVDVVGLSVLSGAHVELADQVLRALACKGAAMPLVVGGTIGYRGQQALRSLGVAAVFPVGTRPGAIVEGLRELVRRYREGGVSG